jgi:parvulin-like peptidyl-prolyl isomerase
VARGVRARYTELMRRVASLALVILALGSGCGDVSHGSHAAAPGDVVARVDSETVTFGDVQAYMGEIRRSFEAQKKAFPDQGTPEYANLEAQAIERLAERLRDSAAAAELGVSAPTEDVEDQLSRLEPKELEKYGVTPERARAELAARALRNEIFKAVVADAVPTDEQLHAYYEQNIETYTHRTPRQALYLWVRDEALADELHGRIAAGEDFLTLVGEYADPDPSVESGLRTFTDEAGGAVETAVFSLDVGELSEPIKAGVGWALVEPVSVLDPGRILGFDEVKKDIRVELAENLQRVAMQSWEKEIQARLGPVYADGWDPKQLHTEIAWDGPTGPQKDPSNCGLPAGTYTYERLVELGCAGGFPRPGIDGPACPELLPGDQFTGGFTSAEVDSGWSEYLVDTAKGSCVTDPRGVIVGIHTVGPGPGLRKPEG